jgi:hypothetical protein
MALLSQWGINGKKEDPGVRFEYFHLRTKEKVVLSLKRVRETSTIELEPEDVRQTCSSPLV